MRFLVPQLWSYIVSSYIFARVLKVFKLKMDSDIKDTLEVIIPNAGAIGLSITDCNEYLTFISLTLAISISLFKLYNWKFKKK